MNSTIQVLVNNDVVSESIIGIAGPKGPQGAPGLGLLGSHTVSSTPVASSVDIGSLAFISDEIGGAILAYSDGVDWRRVNDRKVIYAPRTGSTIDLDFAATQFAHALSSAPQNITASPITNILSCTRSTAGWAERADGSLQQFAANELRITDKGLLIEGARTNYFLNSFSPATQTISFSAGTYILSIKGNGSAVISGGASGTALEGSPASFTLAASASVTITITGTVSHTQVEKGTYASSFIQTTGVTVARAKDIVQFSDLAWLEPSMGTFLVEAGHCPQLFSMLLGNSVAANRLMQIYNPPTKVRNTNDSGQSIVANAGSGGFGGEPNKTALTWDNTGRSLIFNGGTVAKDANAIGDLSTLSIGGRLSTGVNEYFGRINRITYWPIRTPDADLPNL